MMTSQITKDFQMKSKLRKLADGGTYLDGAYNTNVYQQSQLKDGGRVEGPGGRTDDKVGPVMLSDEEYVLPGDTADAIGRDKLDAIRLATHDFKSDAKESALRRKVDHLADGGSTQPKPPPPPANPNVGPNGSRETQAFRNAAGNSFGGAAAASGDASLPRVWSRTRSLLNAGGKLGAVGLAGAGIAGGMEPDSTDRYAERFGVSPPTGDGSLGDLAKFSALRAGGFASDMGSALTVGLADKLYRDKQAVDTDMMASSAGAVGGGLFGKGVGNVVGGALDAGAALVSRGRYKGNTFSKALGGLGGVGGVGAGLYAGKALSDAGGDGGAGSSVDAPSSAAPSSAAPSSAAPSAASPTSALRSDQGPAQPVASDSYQSRRLSEMGVPLDVQNSNPVVNSVTGSTRDFLRTGGTDQYQNLGTYGGNGNIYGRSSTGNGRINEFVGVGAGASPENEYSGSGSGGGAIRSTAASALRGFGGEAAQPAPQPVQPMANNRSRAVDEINARYDRLLEGGRGKAVEFGSDWSQRHGIALEKARGDELSSVLNNENTNATLRANAQLSADTSRSNAELGARVQMADVQSRAETARSTLASQAQAAQRKAVEDARKIGEERDADSVKAYESVADTFAAGDKEKSQYYREVLSTLGPELDQIAQGLTSTDKRAFYTNILRQQVGRDEGLVLGRDVGATVQNAAVGGLIGRMSRLGDGAAGKAVDTALGKIPRVGPVISSLRPAERLTRFGTIIGAGAGASATQEIEDYNRFDPIARDSVSGAALPARKDLREAFTHGVFDTYLNPFNDDVQTVSGRRTNRPNPTEEEAARRYRATLRTE